jgi:hypothetical protein
LIRSHYFFYHTNYLLKFINVCYTLKKLQDLFARLLA